jgi:cytochrome P450
LWTDSNRFQPERFLEVSEDTAAREYRYLPFGIGPRQCIGRHFALLELPLVLATIWQRCELALREKHSLEPEALVTLRPKNGFPVTVRPRIAEMVRSS